MKLGTLVTVKQLVEALAKFPKHLRVLDASWHLNPEREPFTEYSEGHIPGANFFDLEECRNKTSKYAFTLPEPSEFEDYVGHLGIKNDTHVVLYENNAAGLLSTPRVWFNFRLFGHNSISILNGGLPKWVAEGHSLSKETCLVQKENYKAKLNPSLVVTFREIVENVNKRKFRLADAKPSVFFTGQEMEPTGIPGGHIPGAVNITYDTFMTNVENRGYQTLRDTKELNEIFENNGIDLSNPLTTTCSCGITACTIALAAFLCGKKDVPVYDGAWQEYYDKQVRS